MTVAAEFEKDPTGLIDIDAGDVLKSTHYFNVQGLQVKKPQQQGIYIVRETYLSGKVKVKKIWFERN